MNFSIGDERKMINVNDTRSNSQYVIGIIKENKM